MNLKETYNKIAEDWHKGHKQDAWWVGGVDKFISFLRSGSLVLDVGCGTGLKSKYLINRGFKVVGIDFSEKMIETAKREVPEGEFWVMDMEEAAKLEGNFDGIFLQAALLHIKKDMVGEVLCKMLGRLKKRGHVYIAVKEKKPEGTEEEIKREENYGHPYERFFSYFTLEEVKEHLEKLGIRTIYESTIPSGNTRWVQVIGQK